MMTQIGSPAAPPAERRSASPAPAIAALLTFMSAIVTYFVFMLQNLHPRRNDRTRKAPFRMRARGLSGASFRSAKSYRVSRVDAKCWNRREKCAITAATDAAAQGEGGVHGCPIL